MKINLTAIFAGIIGFVLMIVLFSTCTLVSPTEAGFKISKAGDYRGVANLPLVTGYNWTMPGVTEIKTIPTTMQHVVWSSSKDEGDASDQAVAIACQGGAGFKIDVGLNYHVIANDAPKIYLRWKETDLSDITGKFIRNMVRGTMQDISGHLTVDSILQNLPAYESEVRDSVHNRMLAFGFYVDNFNILHQPTPTDPLLTSAINAKIKAKQDAGTAIQELQISIANANKKVATARGDSASSVIEALGRAEAIRALQAQLTPTYVEYVKWSNAGDNVPRVPQYVGAGGFGFPLSKQ